MYTYSIDILEEPYKLQSYEPKNFRDYYKDFLITGDSLRQFIDLDSKDDIGKTTFYDDIVKFLNTQEKNFKKGKIKYLPPYSAPSKLKTDISDKYKISMVDNKDNLKTLLISDCFGLSVSEDTYIKAGSNKYPLVKLRETREDNNLEFIIDYILETRTIGCSLIWPVGKTGTKFSYKTKRGINSYIEDRIDLTLLEIKHAIDGAYDKNVYTDDILYEQYKYSEELQEWFKRFNNFEDYIKYFELTSFIYSGSKYPIDIITCERLNESKANEYKLGGINYNYLKNLNDINKIKEILERLKNLIIDRSIKIANIINSESKK